MHRRQFLSTALQATGGLCTGLALAACSSESGPSNSARAQSQSGAPAASLPIIGLQLYTIRSVMENDFRGAMEQVAEIGYDEVE
ncbi:MAG: sugar phosphate isomerase/epimerase, partial [Salinibacter sp.]